MTESLKEQIRKLHTLGDAAEVLQRAQDLVRFVSRQLDGLALRIKLRRDVQFAESLNVIFANPLKPCLVFLIY
jgi:hypothetical protein